MTAVQALLIQQLNEKGKVYICTENASNEKFPWDSLWVWSVDFAHTFRFGSSLWLHTPILASENVQVTFGLSLAGNVTSSADIAKFIQILIYSYSSKHYMGNVC